MQGGMPCLMHMHLLPRNSVEGITRMAECDTAVPATRVLLALGSLLKLEIYRSRVYGCNYRVTGKLFSEQRHDRK